MKLKSSQHGFTLIELLVAISIFAIIAAISYSTLDQYMKTRDRLSVRYEQLQGLQRLFTLLDRDLRFMVSRPVRNDSGDVEPSLMTSNFTLDGEFIRFTTSAPDPFEIGEMTLKRVAWRVEEGQVYRVVWDVLDRVDDSGIEEIPIEDDVEEITLSFFNWDDGFVKQVSEWSEEVMIPYGVEVLITLKNEQTYRRVFDLASGTS